MQRSNALTPHQLSRLLATRRSLPSSSPPPVLHSSLPLVLFSSSTTHLFLHSPSLPPNLLSSFCPSIFLQSPSLPPLLLSSSTPHIFFTSPSLPPFLLSSSCPFLFFHSSSLPLLLISTSTPPLFLHSPLPHLWAPGDLYRTVASCFPSSPARTHRSADRRTR